MYVRDPTSGPSVRWDPSDQDAAAQALADVSGTGVTSKSEAEQNAPVDLSNEKAAEVRDYYRDVLGGGS